MDPHGRADLSCREASTCCAAAELPGYPRRALEQKLKGDVEGVRLPPSGLDEPEAAGKALIGDGPEGAMLDRLRNRKEDATRSGFLTIALRSGS
ncbi:MAG: hypothetical protein WBC51_08800 [Vicinamibacterales bacterium]